MTINNKVSSSSKVVIQFLYTSWLNTTVIQIVCLKMTVAVLTKILRRFDQNSSAVWTKIMLVTVLTNGCRRFDLSCRRFDHCCRRFGVSSFWHVAVFVVAVPTCRRYDRYPSEVRAGVCELTVVIELRKSDKWVGPDSTQVPLSVMFNLTGLNYFRHFPSSLPSFNHSTSAHVKIMHIESKYSLLDIGKVYHSPCYFFE